MLKLKTTVAACLALSAIGGIIVCSSQMAKSGSDSKTSAGQTSSNPASALRRPIRPPIRQHPRPCPPRTGWPKPMKRRRRPHPPAERSPTSSSSWAGWFNIGAYHRGIMSGKTPNLDKLAAEGMMFTDYYAEASCTAGRANFITGEIPIRTGLTTVGQAGADVGLPAQACTLATALKAQGYATGQFGKNHLGDLNKYLPTVHGFDEFFGYLYHLDAMSDPYWFDYPQDWIDKTGPRDLVHCYATDVDDPTEQPRWGKIGKQKIVDEGPLAPFPDMKDMQNWQKGRKAKYDMETFDDVLVKVVLRVHGQGQEGRQAVLRLAQHHAHARLHLSPAEVSGDDECQEQLQRRRGRHGADGRQHRRTAQAPRRHGRDRQHDRHLHDRQRRRSVHLAGRRHDAVQSHQGNRLRGRLPRARASSAGRATSSRAASRTASSPASTGSPRSCAAAGNPDITDQLLKGVKLGGQTYKNHLDGYNQMDLLGRQRPIAAARTLLLRRAALGALRIDDFKFQFIQQP